MTAFHLLWEKNGDRFDAKKVGSAEDYASCSGITDTTGEGRLQLRYADSDFLYFPLTPMWTTGVSGPYTWQAPTSEGNHYFVCGVSVHCSVGNMKAAVEVSNNCWWPFCNCYNGSDWQINFHSIFIDKSLMHSGANAFVDRLVANLHFADKPI